MSTRLNLALKVFSESVSGKRFNILAKKGRSLYIHDYAQISAQLRVLTDFRMKATANILSLFLDRGRIRIE